MSFAAVQIQRFRGRPLPRICIRGVSMKIRAALVFAVLFALRVSADFPAPSVPNKPMFGKKTYNAAAGSQAVAHEVVAANTSCDLPDTQYTLVVTNGNADGTGKAASGTISVNGTDMAGAELAAGAATITKNVTLSGATNTIDVTINAPAGAAAVVGVEIWRKPSLPVLPPVPYSVTSGTKSFGMQFDAVDPGYPATLIVTRTAGLAVNDTITVKLNGTAIVTRADFTVSPQTVRKPVTLQEVGNLLTTDIGAGSHSASVTVEVRQTGDGHYPEITLGAIPAVVGTTPFTLTGTFSDTGGCGSVTLNGSVPLTVAANGTFSTSLALVHGANNIVLTGYDCAGNAVQTDQKVLFYDTDPPVITMTKPVAGSFTKSTTVAVSGKVTDDGPLPATLKVNGVSVTVSFSGSFSTNATVAAGDGAKTITLVATDRVNRSTTLAVPVTLDATPPSVTATLSPAPTTNGWNAPGAVVTFTCSDSGSGIATCPAPVTVTQSGASQAISGTATDVAGNTAVATRTVNVDGNAPQVTITAPPAAVRATPYALHGNVSDALSGVAAVSCNGVAGTTNGSTFDCSVPLVPGDNALTVAVTDRIGNSAAATSSLLFDQRAPSIAIATPAGGSTVNGATVTVSGSASDDDQLASLRIGGTGVTLDAAGGFTRDVSLVQGDNAVTIDATDRAGNTASTVVHVNRFVVPVVTIASPADLVVLQSSTITVTGTVSDPQATVVVNDITASVSGTNFTAAGVALAQGRTVVTANASSPSGGTATTSINVYRDSIPPRVAVYSPDDNATVYASPIALSGMVDDIVVGTINARQMHVTVNGREAEVSNRAWLLRDLALTPGANTITIAATDEGGNTTVLSHHVTFAPPPPLPHLELVSGNGQTARIATLLTNPIVAHAVAPDGSAMPNAMLTFEVIDSDGTLTAGGTTARVVTVPSDAAGNAAAQWTLGHRAGSGNNRVQIRAAGFAAPIEATATAQPATPHLVVVDSGNNQFGVAGDALPRPLVAIAVDEGNNRLADVPVTFTVVDGGGTFNGQPSLVVNTDSDGRAVARPALGPNAGEDNNRFTAVASGASANATFVASGRAAGPVAMTSVTGVILDNTSVPIAGVSVRIEGTTLTAQTDAQGQFTIGSAPVGYVKLFVDGSTAQRPGTWPTLEYALYTLPGVDNSVGMPIYLLPIDTTRGVFVDDTNGGTLTLPELPGFSLKVAAGSVTFPGGGRTGTVSATLVHADRIPMAPGFGQQPKFIVTIQPAGAHFDPPAPLTFPNVDGLKPGASTEMYSFDHDLGQFVSIGTGTVTADGSTIKSDPGVGLIKAGWHATGGPQPPGATAACGPCNHVVDNACAIDAGQNRHPCPDDGDPSTIDVCMSGECKHLKPTVTVELTSPQDHFVIHPDSQPPNIVATAHVDVPGVGNFDAGAVIKWKAHIYWDPPVRPRVEVRLAPGDSGTVWRFAQPNAGGNLEVTATLIRNGRETVTSRPARETISGSFSGIQPVLDNIDVVVDFAGQGAADRLKLIACHESAQSLNNFNPALHNTPLIGGDRKGVGIMQVTPGDDDPPAPIDVYWDWRANVNVGLSIWYQKTRESNNSIAGARSAHPGLRDLTAAERLDDITRRYNGGKQYEYNAATNDWKEITNHPQNELYVCRVKFESDCYSGATRQTNVCNPPQH
jgi:Glucodextranase, domain B